MRIPGAPPRPASILLAELVSLLDEIEELSFRDARFREFVYDPERCPIRLLGMPSGGPDIPYRRMAEDWEAQRKAAKLSFSKLR